MTLLLDCDNARHFRMRAASVWEVAGFVEGAQVGLVREDVVRLRVPHLFEPDAVVLAFLSVGPAHSVTNFDGDLLGQEFEFDDLTSTVGSPLAKRFEA